MHDAAVTLLRWRRSNRIKVRKRRERQTDGETPDCCITLTAIDVMFGRLLAIIAVQADVDAFIIAIAVTLPWSWPIGRYSVPCFLGRIPRHRHRHRHRHPREDSREDVGVGVDVGGVECGL